MSAAATAALTALTGGSADGVWSAPGRVNLIGEHTDYNDGFVLPFGIEQRTWCALAHRDDRVVRVYSTFSGESREVSLDGIEDATFDGWSAYVFGVVWALTERGVDLSAVKGVDLAIASNVPSGAGLSSSAAIECSVATALNEEWDLGLDSGTLAKVCQRAENVAVGAPTGILDQTASLRALEGHAVFLDCESLESEVIALPLADEGLTVLVMNTHVEHAHATGGYGERRAACERGAEAMGVKTLRGLTSQDLPKAQELLDDVTFRRVKHVVTENERVLETVRLLRSEGARAIGELLLASHASMRDDFEISVPELDLAVETAMAHGAIGARMTGGGFGGSAIAVIPVERVEEASEAVLAAFAEAGYTTPTVFTERPSQGPRRDI
ncbi:galactokinase [Demequina capsici]|uniref:Galactokinase n=1 Tax=Demequina capsici TaxID=3075620 RepID=A0AA96J948_9MICO|nr:galactokinase [Demequina sp. OYTSA14]WNM26010.1 galactokinase [Demequina sp. OYTSA14]